MIHLIEIDAHTGASAVTLRFATEAYITGPSDSPANTIYEPRISDPGAFSANLYQAGQTGGEPSIGLGDITLANADGGLDAWFNYGFDGRRIEIKRLDSASAPFSSAVTVFKGSVETIDTSDAWSSLRVRIFDNRLNLDKPLQVNRYAGTTTGTGNTAEGTEDLRDQPKPIALGRVFGIRPYAVNPFDGIFQVSDGPVSSIQAYDGGSPLTYVGDYGSLAALRAATVLPGRFATCLALGLFRITKAGLKLTADVVEGATTSSRTAAQVVGRVLARAGFSTSEYSVASLSALDALNNAEVGIWIDGDDHIRHLAQQVLASVGAYLVPNANGVFEVGRFQAPGASVRTFTINEVIRKDDMRFDVTNDPGRGIPAYRVIVRYKRNYSTLNGSEVATCVKDNEDYKAFLSTEWREAKAEDLTVKTKYSGAVEVKVDSCLTSLAAAQAEAARLLALYKVRRDRVSLTLWDGEADTVKPGDTVTVQVPRFGYDAGRALRVIGRNDKRAERVVELDLYG